MSGIKFDLTLCKLWVNYQATVLTFLKLSTFGRVHFFYS